jgi:hypothetical protein
VWLLTQDHEHEDGEDRIQTEGVSARQMRSVTARAAVMVDEMRSGGAGAASSAVQVRYRCCDVSPDDERHGCADDGMIAVLCIVWSAQQQTIELRCELGKRLRQLSRLQFGRPLFTLSRCVTFTAQLDALKGGTLALQVSCVTLYEGSMSRSSRIHAGVELLREGEESRIRRQLRQDPLVSLQAELVNNNQTLETNL